MKSEIKETTGFHTNMFGLKSSCITDENIQGTLHRGLGLYIGSL